MTTTHRYRTIDVPVSGGLMRVGIWDPLTHDGEPASVLALHGVTSSHLAWPFVVAQLPGVRVIAPDLRGRGGSEGLEGPAGLAAHAADLDAVLAALELTAVPVIGHSMGAFVAVGLAHLYPDRVQRLVLLDGGLPLTVAEGLDADAMVAAILGPTAERLAGRWDGIEEYVAAFWREHPAFVDAWSPELEAYIAYDLVPEGDRMRPATSYRVTVEDTVDMTTGELLPMALAALAHPTLFISVPRGLRDEEPGLYPAEHRDRVLAQYPGIRHVHLPGLNHYTVVMSSAGAAAIGPFLRAELAEGPSPACGDPG